MQPEQLAAGLPFLDERRSRSITAENPTGEKGQGGRAAGPLGKGRKGSPCLENLAPGQTAVLADIQGTGIIQHIWMTMTDKTTDADRYVLRDVIIRMYWDGEPQPAVECPLGDFFCNGFGQYYPVRSALVAVNPNKGFNCYFSMPFRTAARIEVENQHANPIPAVFYQIDYCLLPQLPENTTYFYAQWRRGNPPEKGQDFVILDGVQGKGRYIGTFMALATLERYWWGEGELKFYLDGDHELPTICGTGTEDYFGGAWSFAAQRQGKTTETTYNTLYMGYPFYSRHDSGIHNPYHTDECPPMRAFYRFHLPDPICFQEDIRVTVQQIGSFYGGAFERADDISTVAYWYLDTPAGFAPQIPPPNQRWPR